MRYTVILITIILLLGTSGLYTGVRIWLKSDVSKICDEALSKYHGDKIEALISTLYSETDSFKTKNNAIWALGKLNDQRAIPALKGLLTGMECDHTRFVCQRELLKAIGTLEGDITDFFTFR